MHSYENHIANLSEDAKTFCNQHSPCIVKYIIETLHTFKKESMFSIHVHHLQTYTIFPTYVKLIIMNQRLVLSHELLYIP
jgi:hypothetical protein